MVDLGKNIPFMVLHIQERPSPCGGCGLDPNSTLVALLSRAGSGSSGRVFGWIPVSSASCNSSCCKDTISLNICINPLPNNKRL